MNRLVLRFNAFSHELVDAYWLAAPRALMTAVEAYAYLAANPKTPCDVLRV